MPIQISSATGTDKCPKCLKSFHLRKIFDKHLPCDGTKTVQHESIPEKAELKFADYEKTTLVPYVMYADIEAILAPVLLQQDTNTVKTRKHRPAAIGNILIMQKPDQDYHAIYVEHVGPQYIVEFVIYIENLCKQ